MTMMMSSFSSLLQTLLDFVTAEGNIIRLYIEVSQRKGKHASSPVCMHRKNGDLRMTEMFPVFDEKATHLEHVTLLSTANIDGSCEHMHAIPCA